MQPQTLEGPVAVSQKGVGFFDDGKSKESIEIQPAALKGALHRDTVKIKILPHPHFNRRQGEVVEIVHRSKSAFVGVAKHIGDNLELIPDDKRCYLPIIIKGASEAGRGERVVGAKRTSEPRPASVHSRRKSKPVTRSNSPNGQPAFIRRPNAAVSPARRSGGNSSMDSIARFPFSNCSQ